ncbi:MAG: ABC transporter permease [Spirochaetales bacterium]|uniref:ABC transporter permease n=1 Tax=Candidatus Thalassospirochaeta sargassi TaxID=3119039 RepID=A0AAJ1IFE6_9SPIO|nr:ABC transporter permease [Spirochaetales bacterium]
MNKILVMIKYNFRRTAARKSFIVLTILGPVLIIAVAVVPGLLAQRGIDEVTDVRIAVYGEAGLADMLIASSPDYITIYRALDFEAAREDCFDGNVEGVLVLPENAIDAQTLQFYTREGSNIIMTETVRNTIAGILTNLRAAEAGIASEQVAMLTAVPEFDIVQLNRDGADKAGQNFNDFIYTAIAFIMLLYMTTLLYSQMIGRSVVTEKTSKTVEVMLSSVRPATLMIGKIAGMGIAGIIQYGIWIGVSLLLMKVVGPALDISMPSLLSADMLGYLILFFLLAFFLYSGLYAVCGALAQDEQSYGQLQIPFIIPLVLPMVMVSYLVMNPEAPVTVFMSFFPLTAPMTMFVRVIVSPPGMLHIILCVAIMLVSIIAVAVGSGKIFRLAILRTGKSMKLTDGFRLLFQRGG